MLKIVLDQNQTPRLLHEITRNFFPLLPNSSYSKHPRPLHPPFSPPPSSSPIQESPELAPVNSHLPRRVIPPSLRFQKTAEDHRVTRHPLSRSNSSSPLPHENRKTPGYSLYAYLPPFHTILIATSAGSAAGKEINEIPAFGHVRVALRYNTHTHPPTANRIRARADARSSSTLCKSSRLVDERGG